MNIDERKLRAILVEQQKRTEKHFDQKLAATEGRLDQKITITEKHFDQKLAAAAAKQQEQTERYLGGLKEDFDHKVDAVMEYVKDIPDIKENIRTMQGDIEHLREKQDIMFDQVGMMAEDITIIKETVKNHEHRITRLETR